MTGLPHDHRPPDPLPLARPDAGNPHAGHAVLPGAAGAVARGHARRVLVAGGLLATARSEDNRQDGGGFWALPCAIHAHDAPTLKYQPLAEVLQNP